MKRYLLLLLILLTRLSAGDVHAQCTIRYWDAFEVGRTALHAIRDTVPHVLECVTAPDERFESGGEGENDPYYKRIMGFIEYAKDAPEILEIRCGESEAGESLCYCLLRQEGRDYTVLILRLHGRNHWFETVKTVTEEEFTKFYMACPEDYRRQAR